MPMFSAKPLVRERYCPTCRAWVQARKPQLATFGHGCLTVVTLGLWLPFAVGHVLWHTATRRYRCPRCGSVCEKK